MNISDPIVFVDDDDDDKEFMVEILAELGMTNLFRPFNQGDDLLHYLHTTSEHPLIILCDINMPKLSGIDILRTIYNNPYLKQKSIPFVFFSTATSPQQLTEAYNLGVQGFFLKGDNYQDSSNKIRMILEYWSTCKHPNSYRRS